MNIKIIATAADGGTLHVMLPDGREVYVDNRIQSTTKGQLYTAHPDKAEAELIPDPDGTMAAAIAEAQRQTHMEYNKRLTPKQPHH